MTGHGSSCGACKFLRRKCTSECVFAPYFSYDQAATHFAAVHKVFGASNVSKLLLLLPVQNRSAAAITMSYEALARMRDPIYGCVAHVFALQQQVVSLQEEIEFLGIQMASSGVAVCASGSHQGSTYPSGKLRFNSQFDAMNMMHSQNQQAEAINNMVYTQPFGSQMNEQSDESNLHESCTNPEIFMNYPWLDMDYNTMCIEGLSWN